MKKILILFLLLLAPQAQSEAELNFKDKRMIVKLSTMKTHVPSTNVTVLEPHEQKLMQFSAISVNALFDHLFGKSWQQHEQVLFTANDGYQSSIPVKTFLQYNSFLAYQKTNKTNFQIINYLQNKEQAQLGPFYLIWDNINKSKDLFHASLWPYQVIAIEFVTFAEKFPKVSPPKNSDAPTQRGFEVFKNFCMNCHSINGDGGKKMIDLNYPSNVTEYMEEARLKKLIRDPMSVSPYKRMPAFPNVENREQQIDDLIAYLKTMAAHKK
jgi:cytochrome c2